MPERQSTPLPTRGELIAALQQFVTDHEASGHFCEGLDAAWARARALLHQANGGRA